MAIIASGQITILDLNDAIVSGTAPANPVVGTLWIDTSVNPNVLKRWNGTQWTPQTLDLGNLDPQAQQDIDNSKITLANMADDTILTRQERSYVKDLVTKIIGTIITDNGTMPTLATLDSSGVGDVATARKSAVNAGISTSHADYVDLGTKYTNLANYLNAMNPKPWDTMSSNNLTINPTTWRNTWLQFYTALGKLNQTVSDKLRQNAEGNLVDNPSITGAVGRWNKGTSPTIENIDFQGKTIPTMKVTTTGDVMVIHDDILVDPSKAYQVSLWFRSSTISTGTVYLGVYAYDSSGANIGIDVVNDSTGAVTAANTNPYAWSGNNSSANTWVQRVFYIMPAGTDNNAMKQLGTNVTSNMRFLSNTRKLRIRWLNYYNSGTTKTVWVAHPRVTEVDPNAVLTAAKAKIDANTANSLIADISNDNKLTPVEKQDVKKEWDIIVGEKPIIEAQANTYVITTEKTNYVNAYNALNTYITPLLSNLNSTSDIVGTTFRANFKAYYDAKTALLKKISDTPKTIIDNIKIGGRNILRKSAPEDLSQMSSHVGSNNTSTVELVDEPSAPKGKAIKITKTNNQGYSNSGGRYFRVPFKLEVGKPYSWSIKVKGTGTLNIGQEQGGQKSVTLTDQYQEITHTFTANSSQYYQFVFYGSGNFEVYIHSLKLEEGNKPTTWTPAPEDTQSQIDGLGTRVSSAETSITQLSNQIQLKANQTTVDTLTNQISSAQSQINLLSNQIDLKVNKNGVISAINISPETIKLSANKINLDGFVEAKHIKSLNGLNVNGQFIVDSQGNVKFTGRLEGASGSFTGEVISQYSTDLNEYKAVITEGNISIENYEIPSGIRKIIRLDGDGIYQSVSDDLFQRTPLKIFGRYGIVLETLAGFVDITSSVNIQGNTDVQGSLTANTLTSRDTIGFGANGRLTNNGGTSWIQGDEIRATKYKTSADYVNFRANWVYADSLDVNTGVNLYVRPRSGGEVRATVTGGTGTYVPVRAASFPTASLAEYKQDIHPWEESALEKIRQSTIYEYYLKSELEQGIQRKRQGLVIGEGYNTPEGVIDGDGVEQYLMNAWSWKAIQELDKNQQNMQSEIEYLKLENQHLKQKIEQLEEMIDNIILKLEELEK